MDGDPFFAHYSSGLIRRFGSFPELGCTDVLGRICASGHPVACNKPAVGVFQDVKSVHFLSLSKEMCNQRLSDLDNTIKTNINKYVNFRTVLKGYFKSKNIILSHSAYA